MFFLRFYEVNYNSLDNRIVSGIFRHCEEKQIHYMKNKVKAVGVILINQFDPPSDLIVLL